MAPKSNNGKASTTVTTRTEQALEEFRNMGFMVPEIEQDGGMGIVLDILSASSLAELDATWQETETDAYVGYPLIFHEVQRGESEFADGLGMYLRVRATVVHSGEQVSFSTGSISVVAQLVRAYALELFPFVATLTKADKPSRNGYYPQHLTIEEDQTAAGE